MPDYNHKDALHRAGRLAIAVQLVLGCKDPLALSDQLRHLRDVLNEYDDYILAWAEQDSKKKD